jgi:hypothetical protein
LSPYFINFTLSTACTKEASEKNSLDIEKKNDLHLPSYLTQPRVKKAFDQYTRQTLRTHKFHTLSSLDRARSINIIQAISAWRDRGKNAIQSKNSRPNVNSPHIMTHIRGAYFALRASCNRLHVQTIFQENAPGAIGCACMRVVQERSCKLLWGAGD